MCAVWQENASASSTKIDNCFQSLVSGLQQGGRSKLYPHSVSTPIDEASIPIWFDAWLLGWNEGRVLPSCGIFQTSWVKPAPYACQPKNKAAKTPHAEFADSAGPQTKLRTGRKLPVLYYIS
jgi:hypothetical protein